MSAPIHRWSHAPLPTEVERALQRLANHPHIGHVAAMPDAHLAGEGCAGVAVGARQHLLPQLAGSDLGCGVSALRLGIDAELLRDRSRAARLLAALDRAVPTLAHRSARPMPEGLRDRVPLHEALRRPFEREAPRQLGTLGRGNHFVELQRDEAGWLWLMVHSGSRGFGPAVQAAHLRPFDGEPLVALPDDSEEAQAWLHDLSLARAFAKANREALVEACCGLAVALLGASPEPATLIDCDHDHVERETHLGVAWWVHRKGAICAAAGRPGAIPGSMGTASFHVTGRGLPESLGSSSHGAGRRDSRTEARRRIGRHQLEREMEGVWFDHRRSDALREEAPAAYRPIEQVMQGQRQLTRIERRLLPLLVFKGG